MFTACLAFMWLLRERAYKLFINDCVFFCALSLLYAFYGQHFVSKIPIYQFVNRTLGLTIWRRILCCNQSIRFRSFSLSTVWRKSLRHLTHPFLPRPLSNLGNCFKALPCQVKAILLFSQDNRNDKMVNKQRIISISCFR